MDENKLVKKKSKKNYYRHQNYQGKNYYKKQNKKKKVLDTGENILLSKQEEIKPIKEVLKENIPDYEEIDITPKKKSNKLRKLVHNNILKYSLGIVLIFAIVIGVSYAFFNYTRIDSRQANIAAGEIYIKIIEDETSINLSKIYPQTDAKARGKSDNYLDFTIKAKNTSQVRPLYYKIAISDGDSITGKTRIDPEYIKIDLQEKINGDYVYIQNGVRLSEYSYKGFIPVNTSSEVTKELRLRLWVSDDVYVSNSLDASYTPEEFTNLYGTFNISLSSYDGMSGVIETCPGCKFIYATDTPIYTTWNSLSMTPTVLNNGLYSDYSQLVAQSGKNYFLGVQLNENNEVVKSYACGVKNNFPFCIEGTRDGSSYGNNGSFLQSYNVYNNTCSLNTSGQFDFIQCLSGDTSVSSYTYSTGDVFVGVNNDGSCRVYNTGGLECTN